MVSSTSTATQIDLQATHFDKDHGSIGWDLFKVSELQSGKSDNLESSYFVFHAAESIVLPYKIPRGNYWINLNETFIYYTYTRWSSLVKGTSIQWSA